MVNDLLNELYMKVTVLHMGWLLVGVITIDKYWLSMVIDFTVQIGNVGLPGSVESPANPGFSLFFAQVRWTHLPN